MSGQPAPNSSKQDVSDFWSQASCGEELYLSGHGREDYARQAESRYQLEPYILDFARFEEARGKDVLEIGVGLGADHQKFAEAGARLSGIDLTERAVEHTRRRLAAFGLSSELRVGDSEALPFPDNSFDMVYAWGVIHHSPDTAKAAAEIMRVLRPGGRFAVMVYNRYSLIGYMLWVRYALLAGKPLTGLDAIYSRHLESPGTKAYTPQEAAALFSSAASVGTRVELSHGDLLESEAGQRHRGILLSTARLLWPRAILRKTMPGHGLFLLVEGFKRR